MGTFPIVYDDAAIKIEHPDGLESAHRQIRLGHIDLVFSYDTLIAYRENIRSRVQFTKSGNYKARWTDGEWVMRVNDFSISTGRHMSYYGVPKEDRVPDYVFWNQFKRAMTHPRTLLQQVAEEAFESMDWGEG